MEEVCCELKYSGVGWAFLATAVTAPLALVVLAPFPDEARALAFAWVIGLSWHAHAKIHGVRALRVDSTRGCATRNASGAWRGGTLRDGSFVAPWLTIVRWRPEGARLDRCLVILPGTAPAEARRRIRVILKWA